EVVASLDLPAFTNAAMDGYAVRAADCGPGIELPVVGQAFAGHPYQGELFAQSTVRITTGAELPAGADAVVMQEHANRRGDRVAFSASVRVGQNVRQRGGHVRVGEKVITAGRVLHAAEIGLATALGVTHVDVFRRVRIGLASTGDELADPPAPLIAS